MEKLTWVRCGEDSQIGTAKAELRRLLAQDGYTVVEQPTNKSLTEFLQSLPQEPKPKQAILLNIEAEVRTLEHDASYGKRLSRAESQTCAEYLLAMLNSSKLEGAVVYGFLYRHMEERDRLHFLVDELIRGASAKQYRTASLYV